MLRPHDKKAEMTDETINPLPKYCEVPKEGHEAGVLVLAEETCLADGMAKHSPCILVYNPTEVAHTFDEDWVISRALL